MKKIFNLILCIAVISALASSCDSLLKPESPSSYEAETVYSNYNLAEGTVFAITEAFCIDKSYRNRFLPWYGFNTDIEWYNTYNPGGDQGKSDIGIYDCRPDNGQLNEAEGCYTLMYTAIERANLAIEGLRQYGDVQNKEDMAYLLGEALTLRAMIYYDLCKAWGDVPARFEPVVSETIYLPKSSREVIFKQLLTDLDEAIGYLPYPGKTTQTRRTDRINKVFAEGLYARIALMASGYALRPEEGMVGQRLRRLLEAPERTREPQLRRRDSVRDSLRREPWPVEQLLCRTCRRRNPVQYLHQRPWRLCRPSPLSLVEIRRA